MNAHWQPLPRQVAEELLQVVTRAMCDRPADSGPQRESRTRQMIHSVLGFEPRDGLEYMLATIAFGHFQLILDSIRDVFQGQSDAMKAKNKTTIVALDRMMLEMIEKLSVVRRRPMAHSGAGKAEDAVPVAAEPIEAGVAPEPVAAKPSAAPKPATSATGPRRPRSAAARPDADVAQADAAPSDASQTDRTQTGFAAFARTMLALTEFEAGENGSAPATSAATPMSASAPDAPDDGISAFLAPHAAEEDGGTFEDHIAAFQDAYAATMETLAEARALERAKSEAASGD